MGANESAEEIKQAVIEDTLNGVTNFSDGTNNVSMLDPMKRLEIADKLRRDNAATTGGGNPSFGLRFTKINGPAGGFQ